MHFDEPDENEWAAMISEAWVDDLSDANQDIYTVNDGKPVDERR